MIFITGDTHIPHDIAKLNSKNFPEGRRLTKNDYVIVCGDFGLLWKNHPDGTEKFWKDWLTNIKPWTTLFIDGNHENFFRLKNLPVVNKFGGKVGKVSDSIFHLKRGEIYNICGYSVFAFGGGESIDRNRRVTDLSWWREERHTYAEQMYGLANLTAHNNAVDVILTHTCSESVFKVMRKTVDLSDKEDFERSERDFYDEILDTTQFQHWCFGHFHIDYIPCEAHYCLYNKLVKLEDIQ